MTVYYAKPLLSRLPHAWGGGRRYGESDNHVCLSVWLAVCLSVSPLCNVKCSV